MNDFIPHTELKLTQTEASYKMTSDSIHLTQFMLIRSHDIVLDVGCSSGVLSLVAASKTKGLVVGIDIDPKAIALAKLNMELNGLTNLRFTCIRIQDYANEVFDVIVCNPPYYKEDQTLSHNHPNARFDLNLSLKELSIHGKRLLKDKGRLVIIIPVERFTEWLLLTHEYGLAIKRCAFIHHSQDRPAKTVLVEAIKNGKGTMRVEAPRFNR
jgi:tRNA1Val (adenine37-N6)-methyltransferase